MGSRDEIARLLKDAAAAMKRDAKGAVATLEAAYAIARESGNADDTAVVAEELARGWARRKSAARALHYACKATKLAPEQKSSWTTLAKTCELVASRQKPHSKRRSQALYRATASAFKKAASMTKDPEDKRWLLELAGDASRQAKA
ncbi:MAG: hypothetical protein JNL38_30430 [Myxococcales bacterium]|jgi:hypothetical protein|nr:hypothetical protein [Myxococcales bacterium]